MSWVEFNYEAIASLKPGDILRYTPRDHPAVVEFFLVLHVEETSELYIGKPSKSLYAMCLTRLEKTKRMFMQGRAYPWSFYKDENS